MPSSSAAKKVRANQPVRGPGHQPTRSEYEQSVRSIPVRHFFFFLYGDFTSQQQELPPKERRRAFDDRSGFDENIWIAPIRTKGSFSKLVPLLQRTNRQKLSLLLELSVCSELPVPNGKYCNGSRFIPRDFSKDKENGGRQTLQRNWIRLHRHRSKMRKMWQDLQN